MRKGKSKTPRYDEPLRWDVTITEGKKKVVRHVYTEIGKDAFVANMRLLHPKAEIEVKEVH